MKPDAGFGALHDVFAKIDASLTKDISLAELAFLSASSYFHFHRRFSAIAKEPVGKYVRRLILERAAYEIKISEKSISEVAFESGFLSHEAFTRAFRRQFGQAPAAYKKAKRQRSLSQVAGDPQVMPLRFVTVPVFRIAYLRYVGDYANLPGPISSHTLTKQLELVAAGLGFGLAPTRLLAGSHFLKDLCPVEVADFELKLDLWLLRATAPGNLSTALDVLGQVLVRTFEIGRPSQRGRDDRAVRPCVAGKTGRAPGQRG